MEKWDTGKEECKTLKKLHDKVIQLLEKLPSDGAKGQQRFSNRSWQYPSTSLIAESMS